LCHFETFLFFSGVFGAFYFKKRPFIKKWGNFGAFCAFFMGFAGFLRVLLPAPRPILRNFGGGGGYPLPLRKNYAK